jgi:hypothetical protein
MNPNQQEVETTMNAIAENFEEELTVDLPADAVMVRSIGLVPAEVSSEEETEDVTVVEVLPLAPIYPPHYEPPIGRAVRNYFKECRERARALREHERIQFADTLYHRTRRLLISFYVHMKENATSRPWEEYEKRLSRSSMTFE